MLGRITLPRGYSAGGLSCGIKNDPAKLDLALFVSDRPAVAAGVFTQNRICGAPVKVSRGRVPTSSARAVVINSGNSNACTGERGVRDAETMTARVAEFVGCSASDVLVCSTGVIGSFLPMDKLHAGIASLAPTLGATEAHFHAAARAMMTTDTFPKEVRQQVEIDDDVYFVYGCAKGAAMIAPNMATMLSVLLTDAPLAPDQADRMLRAAVNRSFNCISVEGHTSTSDTVLLLANAAADSRRPIGGAEPTLQAAIDHVAAELAQAIIRDAEGADHFIAVDVRGARTREEAHRIAKAVAESPLVKTAICGADPNWGRIVSAAGYCGVALKEEDVSLTVNGARLYERGAPVPFDAAAVSETLRTNRDVTIELDLALGSESIRFWTSDLTCEYVRLNSDYTT